VLAQQIPWSESGERLLRWDVFLWEREAHSNEETPRQWVMLKVDLTGMKIRWARRALRGQCLAD